tara:strand:- start:3024 stop:3407 length:384 start_codon:yes stop_codon:yes gene_type:complete
MESYNENSVEYKENSILLYNGNPLCKLPTYRVQNNGVTDFIIDEDKVMLEQSIYRAIGIYMGWISAEQCESGINFKYTNLDEIDVHNACDIYVWIEEIEIFGDDGICRLDIEDLSNLKTLAKGDIND